jgi:hypothetical protein
MIITNGAILGKMKTGGGIDPKTKYPVQPSEIWDLPIPCQYKTSNSSSQQYFKGSTNDNHFIDASYTILIEEQPFEYEQIQIVSGKKKIGEFSITKIEQLPHVGLIKITV